MIQQITRSTSLPITNLALDQIKLFDIADVPAGVDTNSLLFTLLLQQSELFEKLNSTEARLENIETELCNLTLTDPDAHTDDICKVATDARNPQTVKDYLALIKTEVRRMDDCDRSCFDAPWAVSLSLEISSSEDIDENNWVFGLAGKPVGFIFNEPFGSYPDMLANSLTKKVFDEWTGPTLTFNDYEATLPAGSCTKEQFVSWRALTGF